jgi:hypothetical protein
VVIVSDSISTGPPRTASSTYQNLAGIDDGQVIGDY